MQRLLIAAAALAGALGLAGPGEAQTYRPHATDPAISYKIIRVIPNSQTHTSRRGIADR
jgi:hypothetical protein